MSLEDFAPQMNLRDFMEVGAMSQLPELQGRNTSTDRQRCSDAEYAITKLHGAVAIMETGNHAQYFELSQHIGLLQQSLARVQ